MDIFTQVDISRAILQHFGADHNRPTFIPDDSQAVVLWVADGFGLNLWRDYSLRGLMPKINEQTPKIIAGRSIFPTTTAAGLASYTFAAPPATHGALGFWIYLPEIGRSVNMLTGLDETGQAAPPHILYPPMPTIFDRLADCGIASAVVSPAPYQTSSLSRWLYSGAIYVPYPVKSPLEAINLTRDALSAGCRFIWIYWPYIDAAAHRTGLTSPRMEMSIAQFDTAYGNAVTQWQFPFKVTIIVGADHGMMALSPEHVINKSAPYMTDIWNRPWAGERRALTTELSQEDIKARLKDYAIVYSQEEIWENGWYGGPPARQIWRQRVLNTLALAHPLYQFEQDPARDTPIMSGAHGALTPEETEIPISVQTLSPFFKTH